MLLERTRGLAAAATLAMMVAAALAVAGAARAADSSAPPSLRKVVTDTTNPRLHGYLFDTSEMMYLDKDNTWVRGGLVSSAVGDPVVRHTAGDGRRSSGRTVHKTESWGTHAAQR